MRTLYWFRSDLRMADNNALADAMRNSDFLIALFILTPDTWKEHSAAPCKIRFILENLKTLSESLWKQGITLLIRNGPSFSDCPGILDKICKQFKIDALHFNHEYPLDERRRDEAVIKKLSINIDIHTYHEQLVLPPGTILNKQNSPFKVFTPYKNAWLSEAQNEMAWHSEKKVNKKFIPEVKPNLVPSKLEGFAEQSIIQRWQPGEKEAQKRLKEFCQNKINSYKDNRDYPGIDGTSMLSPYLAQGVLSPRQCITLALEVLNTTNINNLERNKGVATWVMELIWREFYYNIVYNFPDVCRNKPFKPSTENIPWSNDKNLFESWKKGVTGFPIVDAGMRQLLATGWMHNRVRMITAMFLSKILLLDWRLGEKHFMEHLIDGDFASNNGGWQWCASTGTDAVPYFRIFNPTTQSQRFDPDGDYIRQYCPELSQLDNKKIHAPFMSGVNPNDLNYPQPIVDYKFMRNETLRLFKAL